MNPETLKQFAAHLGNIEAYNGPRPVCQFEISYDEAKQIFDSKAHFKPTDYSTMQGLVELKTFSEKISRFLDGKHMIDLTLQQDTTAYLVTIYKK
jgi:hypothetical protein